MKKCLAYLLTIVSLFSLMGCTDKNGGTDSSSSGNNGEVVTGMKEIEYEMTKNKQRTGANVNLIIPPASTAKTGANLTAYVTPDISMDNYNYYVVDWGDGTWSYNGPYVYNEDNKVVGEVYHTYKKAGEYQIKACAMNMETGKMYGWTPAQTLKVTGSDYVGEMVTAVTPISSTTAGEDFAAANVADGNNQTRWQSAVSDSISSNDYVCNQR